MEILANIYERNRMSYIILLILSAVFIIIASVRQEFENFVLAIPTLVLTLIAFLRKDKLYIPPLFVIMVGAVMTLLQVTKYSSGDYEYLSYISDNVFGMFTCILGLMIVLAMLKSSPSFDVDQPFFVSFASFCIGITLSLCILIAEYAYSSTPMADFITGLVCITIGAALISILFYMNRHNGLFEHTLGKFLSGNADALDLEDRERELIRKDIAEGESSKLEFKSTLRTNLKTGEKDPRMERAVMKTIVAFLNSRGGTLLIGVADDGTILGIDLQAFDNSKDKFGLHLNHLITNQVGEQFLPFINYAITDFDGKSVMRVVCGRSDRPVFLTDGKEEIFYVRSGPSTIDLTGLDLLYYANHNFGKSLKKRD